MSRFKGNQFKPKETFTFKDLDFQPHVMASVNPGAVQAKFTFPNGSWISVVGGGIGLYGDGVNTFEIMSSLTDSDVEGWLTPEEVTEHMLKLSDQ